MSTFAQAEQPPDIFSPGFDFAAKREGAWSRYFRLGALAGLSLDADFSVSGQIDMSNSRPGEAGVGGVDHFYDDGYVRVDQTGNAQGWTSFWGYNDAAQLSGNTLIMHSTRGFEAQSGTTGKGDAAAVGLEVAYGGLLFRHNEAMIGWEFGFGWLPVKIDAPHFLEGSVTRTVHAFDTGGIIVPTAPYSGGDSGIGPTIRDIATALPDDQTGASLSGSQTLDLDMFLFKLGPTMFWELNRRLGFFVSIGGAFGFVPGKLEFTETFDIDDGSSSINRGKISDTEFTFGGYLSSTLTYRLEEHGDIYLSLQYMPMSSVSISGSGRRAELDMMGSIFLSAGINWPF